MPRKKSGLFDQREYVNRYHRETIARKNVTFNRGKPEDMALMEWAEKQPEGFVAYVKRLIREDMRQPLPKHFDNSACEICRDTAREDKLLNCSQCPESKR